MENISIETSQNIVIEQTIASVGERMVATAIDFSFYFIYYILILIVVGVSQQTLLFVLLAPIAFYHLISESAMNGQSWGKKIMKIKVVKIDGSQALFMSYFIRWIFRIIDIVFFFGAISTVVIIVNGKGQRIGDLVANTTVIRLKEKTFTNIYTKLPDNYSLVFTQVSRLKDDDIYTAREVIDFVYEAEFSADSKEMAEKAKKALESKLGIQSNLTCIRFLETIINDYNFIHSK